MMLAPMGGAANGAGALNSFHRLHEEPQVSCSPNEQGRAQQDSVAGIDYQWRSPMLKNIARRIKVNVCHDRTDTMICIKCGALDCVPHRSADVRESHCCAVELARRRQRHCRSNVGKGAPVRQVLVGERSQRCASANSASRAPPAPPRQPTAAVTRDCAQPAVETYVGSITLVKSMPEKVQCVG